MIFYLAIKKYVSLNLKEYSTFVFILVFSNYPVVRYWKLAISKTGAKFTLAHQKNIKVSLITSSIDSNFNNEQYHKRLNIVAILTKSKSKTNVSDNKTTYSAYTYKKKLWKWRLACVSRIYSFIDIICFRFVFYQNCNYV